VEVADWDLRAQLAGIPRTISTPAAAAAEPPTTTHAAAASSAAAEAAGAAAASERDGAPARVGSGSPGTPPAGSSPGGSPRSSGQRDADEPVIAAAVADALADAEARAAGAASAVAEPAGPGRGVPAGPPPVAALDLVVKAFDTQKWVPACCLGQGQGNALQTGTSACSPCMPVVAADRLAACTAQHQGQGDPRLA